MRARLACFGALLTLCALAAGSLWRAPLGRVNVVLITVDTLRADALSPYGGPRGRTPAAERLAREGLLFENAFCPMPQTRPSHASILTSQQPREHGVLNNATALGPQALTLTEVLKSHGYQTAGLVSVKLMDPSSGASQGFDEFSAPEAGAARTADETVTEALRYLDRVKASGSPFFLWLHLFDPHMPYAPPEQFRSVPDDGSPALEAEFSWPRLRELARQSDGALPQAVLAQGKRLYQGEVSFQDHWIGQFLEHLDVTGLTERTLLVLTADHGECFEHGVFFEHTDCLYDAAMRVPLILRFPGRLPAGIRDPRLVESVDIAPSVLDLVGLGAVGSFRGRSLVNGGKRDATFFERPLYHEEAARNRPGRNEDIRSVGGQSVLPVHPERDWLAVRTLEWKLVSLGDEDELYRVAADPAEAQNLIRDRGGVAAELRQALRAWRARHPVELDRSRINEDLRETLRSLGYVR